MIPQVSINFELSKLSPCFQPALRKSNVKVFFKASVHRYFLSILVSSFFLSGNTTQAADSSPSTGDGPAATEPVGLQGEWCKVKKRRVTKYTVKNGQLRIRSGRSGQLHEAALTCNDDFTECVARTQRGWGTPVTETMRLDGVNMHLTRVWGGSWKDKTYEFTFTRCPKW